MLYQKDTQVVSLSYTFYNRCFVCDCITVIYNRGIVLAVRLTENHRLKISIPWTELLKRKNGHPKESQP